MRSPRINQKLTISYILIILITVLTIGVLISVIFSGQLAESSRKQLDLRIEAISGEIEEQLLKVMKITEEVSGNRDLLHRINEESFIPEIRNILIPTENRSPLIERIILINHNLEILDPVYSRPLYERAILSDDDFTEFLSRKYFYYFAKPGVFPIDMEKESPGSLTITLYQRLLDENYWLMGYQLAVLNKKMLFSSIWKSSRDQIFSGINIYNERNVLFFSRGAVLSPEEIDNSLNYSKLTGNMSVNAKVNGKRYLILVKLIPSVNWYVTGIIPYSSIYRNLYIVLQIITFIGILFTLVTGLISYLIARTITKPILTITEAMHSYEKTGDLKKIDIKATGELKYLSQVYNKLVNQINQFIKNIYREQEEKRVAELRSLQYELDFLQAQINPHFIHNTLNAIGFQAEKDGNVIVFESLKSFNILLRAAISGTEEMITLKEEMNLVENFVKIQRLRYGDTFELAVDFPKELLYERVPKLILQPLVENAVFHGIEPLGKPGIINIKICRKGPNLVLKVSDNGMGMDTEKLSNARKFNRIGLQNVDERIKILFGESYGLKIESKEGQGTTILIEIPAGRGRDV